MTVVTFEDYRPTARFDGKPWVDAMVQEASLKTGPWTLIDTFPLSPVDADPTLPASRSFTTENATLGDGGWYRVIFRDADGDEELPTEPQRHSSDTPAYSPTVQDVGNILLARTRDENGAELGTFTSDTRPTGDAVAALVAEATAAVEARVGDVIPDAYVPNAKRLVTLMAAMLVELSYFPEQVNGDNSAYEQYRQLYEEGMTSLLAVVQGDPETSGAGTAVSVPMHSLMYDPVYDPLYADELIP